jgi:NTE family protein
MTTAFVLSGGGSLGAVQVGMLKALAEYGVRPDVLVGTSAGALNATWVAAHGMSGESLDGLASIWTGLRRTDIFPIDTRRVLRAALGLGTALTSPHRLARLVTTHAGIEYVEEAAVPLHLLATDLLSGKPALISNGPLASGVLASAAIPGVFPPVERYGRFLVDGGVSGQSGVGQAVELGATTIYVVPAGAACALRQPPRSAIGVALHALSLLLETRTANEIARYSSTIDVKILPPLCPLAVSAADFGHAEELINRSHAASLDWVAGGGLERPSPERFLSVHEHGHDSAPAQPDPSF